MPADHYRARTLPQVVAEAAAAFGDRIAVTDGEVRLSYEQLDAARIRAARAFIAAGLGHGDRIAIWAPNIYQWIIAAIGAQSIGGVLVPLNTRLKGAEAAYILQASGARLLFTVDEFIGVKYPELLQGHGLPALERTILLRGGATAGAGVLGGLPRRGGCGAGERGPAARRRAHPRRHPGYPVHLGHHRQAQGRGHLPRPEYPHLRHLECHGGPEV